MGDFGSYLRGDYAVRCDNNDMYSSFVLVASINVTLYLIGVPAFFYSLIKRRNEEWAKAPSQPLHSNFIEEWAYYEVFELFRKILLVSIVAFVIPDSATQCLYLFLINTGALLILSFARPYISDSDDLLSAVMISTECFVFLVAFLIVSDVSSTDNYNRESLMNAVLAMVIVVFVFFVPLNIMSKIPSISYRLNHFAARIKDYLQTHGIYVPTVGGLDARSRFEKEVFELRLSLDEARNSIALPVLKKSTVQDLSIKGKHSNDFGSTASSVTNPIFHDEL